MKKILALLLLCVMAFAVVSCDDPEPASEFAIFEEAIDQTPASKITVETVMTTQLGDLKSVVTTEFKPDGSAVIDYRIEKFNPDFSSSEIVIPVSKTVILNKDGSYSDGGEFQGLLGENIASVNLRLDAAKFESYEIQGGDLSAVIAAENTASVLGVEIDADTSILLSVSNNRVKSLVMKYTTESGDVMAICTYN